MRLACSAVNTFIQTSRVYYELTMWPAPSWLDGSAPTSQRSSLPILFKAKFFPDFLFAAAFKSCVVRNNEDLSSIWSFLRSSNICFIYLHLFIHPSQAYYELTMWSAPSWLKSSVGKALHRHRRGHGFASRSSLIFFQSFFFPNCFSCVVTARIFLQFDLSSVVHIYFIYLHLFIHPSRVY